MKCDLESDGWLKIWESYVGSDMKSDGWLRVLWRVLKEWKKKENLTKDVFSMSLHQWKKKDLINRFSFCAFTGTGVDGLETAMTENQRAENSVTRTVTFSYLLLLMTLTFICEHMTWPPSKFSHTCWSLNRSGQMVHILKQMFQWCSHWRKGKKKTWLAEMLSLMAMLGCFFSHLFVPDFSENWGQ